MKFQPPILLSILLIIFPFRVFADSAQEEAEFDAGMLMPINGSQAVDVKRFRFGNPIPSGEYQSDVFVNGKRRGQVLLNFVENEQQPMNGLCLSQALLVLLDVKPEALKAKSEGKTCARFTQIIPEAKATFDMGLQRLDIVIPQILLNSRPEGYIPPSQWQAGVPVVFLNYAFNQYQYDYDDRKNRYAYLGLRAGANLGKWALRHSGTQTWDSHRHHAYRGYETYLQRDVDALKGRLTIGDFQTGDGILEYFGIRGLSLASDRRMLPESLNRYAPVVRGVANSNARVVVRQNGHIVHETTVPAGLFVIDDIAQASYGDDLQVEIMEDNGSRRVFSVPVASSGQMLRPKQWTYYAAAGRYRDSQRVYPSNVVQASARYGLNNWLTLKSGLTATSRYWATHVGGIWDFQGNTIETDVQAASLKGDQKRQHAQSLRIAYTRFFEPTHTYVYAHWHRYFSDHAFDVRDAILSQHDAAYQWYRTPSYTNKYQVSLNQRLGKKAGSLYVSGALSQQRYHGLKSHEYQVGYSNSFKDLQYNFVFAKTHQLDTHKSDKQFYVNLSIPLFHKNKDLDYTWLSASYQRNQYQDSTTQATLSGTLGVGHRFNYSLSALQRAGQRGYSAASSYRAPFALFNASASKNGSDTQLAYGVSGNVVAHRYGLTLSRDLGETFAIVRAKDAAGARIRNHADLRLDRWGNGVIPNLTPYRVNHIGIDPDQVPDNVEIGATAKEVVPRAHAVPLIQLETRKGYPVLFQLQGEDGKTLPPMASEVIDESGKVVGYVVQGGQLFAHVSEAAGWLKVVWGNRDAEQCYVQYAFPAIQGANDLLSIPAVCEHRIFPLSNQ